MAKKTIILSSAALLLMALALLATGRKGKYFLRSDVGPPKTQPCSSTSMKGRPDIKEEEGMEDGQYVNVATAARPDRGRRLGLFMRRRLNPSAAEVEKAAEGIAFDVTQAIADYVDTDNPIQVQEALQQLALATKRQA